MRPGLCETEPIPNQPREVGPGSVCFSIRLKALPDRTAELGPNSGCSRLLKVPLLQRHLILVVLGAQVSWSRLHSCFLICPNRNST